MNISERFIRYTTFDTQSSEDSETVPSTQGQTIFAQFLKNELESEGLTDVELDDKGYIYATLPGNTQENISRNDKTVNDTTTPTIGFIAHYDTSPECNGANIKAHIINKYDGDDISLREGITMSPTLFPELLNHLGEDIIVTDGSTLLGADDKAGIAEIIEAISYLRNHPNIIHGNIRIAFTPDEEIGRGAHHFDVEKFGCQWAYTIDGGEVGELEYENFNAASAIINIKGVNVHPGYAKNKMLNACLLTAELAGALPPSERPETTEGYEGFYHLTSIEAHTDGACMKYIIRDHNYDNFEKRKHTLLNVVAEMNKKYIEGTVHCTISDQYFNMKEKIEPNMHIIDIAERAMTEAGITPCVIPIRGGTDGAQLSFMGLPCPNLFTGGMNFHSPYEYIPIQSMEKAVKVIVNICRLTAQQFSMK